MSPEDRDAAHPWVNDVATIEINDFVSIARFHDLLKSS